MLKQESRTQSHMPSWCWKAVGWCIASVAAAVTLRETLFYHPAANLPAGNPAAAARSGGGSSPRTESAAYPKAVAAAFSSANPADKDLAFTVMLPELAKRNIAAAARLAEDLKPWARREEVMLRVSEAWAEQDPAAATEWAALLPDKAERRSIFAHVCIAVGKTDPTRALELMDHHEAESDPSLREQLIQLLAVKNPAAALESAEALPDGEPRQRAIAKVAMTRAEVSPQEAARLVAEKLPPGDLQDQAALAVLHQWILRDPGGARAWVEIFPDGELMRVAEAELAAAGKYPAPE